MHASISCTFRMCICIRLMIRQGKQCTGDVNKAYIQSFSIVGTCGGDCAECAICGVQNASSSMTASLQIILLFFVNIATISCIMIIKEICCMTISRCFPICMTWCDDESYEADK
mmetsp:Transcript_27210/g.45958  ORF Transcript_27210/g.45958 Transcript_27210/m.45958 type:complete len:114 (+) Transcript_27210:1315-1656(+)